jgi:HAD superfamily hydrolase (TIGR01509 family)
MSSRCGVLFDVDGTLVDTNYLHVVAWWQAFRAFGHDVDMATLHRAVGKGSDNFVSSILGHHDEAIADAHTDFYGPHMHNLLPLPGAVDLIRTTKKSGLVVVLATSASAKEAEHLTAALGCDDVIDAVTTKDDADESKPSPDIVQTALDKAGLTAENAVFVGDTVWDVEAATKAGLECVCVTSGGLCASDLREAGAVALFRDAAELVADFGRSPLGRLAQRQETQA